MQSILYSEDHMTAFFDNYKFKKDKNKGYYLSSKLINGKRKRLHVYVWEYFNGFVEQGYQIHHKDHNKDNNEIENLIALRKEDHQKLHKEEMTEETKEKLRDNMHEKALPKAIEWHKSEAGRAWHKENYEKHKDSIHKTAEYVCEVCGKKFTTSKNSRTCFCSNNCKSAYRRKSGVDNIETECKYCKGKFFTNKYSPAKYCEKHRDRIYRV